jgi:hypothetical protein
VSLTPARICDTRPSTVSGLTDQCTGKTLDPAGTLNVQVTGKGGVPATGVSAVVLNVTVAGTTSGGYLTVWPTGEPQPLASNLNWRAGETVPNLVEVGVGTSGQVSFYNSAGSTDLIVDVEGYIATSTTGTSGLYEALPPARICDTRPSTVSGLTDQCTGKTLGPAGTLNVQVTGKGGVPATGVSAVVMNITVAGTTSGGVLTVWPTGEPQPLASNLNWRAGETVANRVIVPVGSSGQVSVYNLAGNADVIIDVTGWYTNGTNTNAVGATFVPIAPARICDTRPSAVSGLTDQCTGKTLGPAGTLNVQVTGKGGVPATGVSAVVMNVTVAGTTSGGFLTVWPAGEAQPLASDINWRAGEIVPNLVVATLGAGGQVSVYNSSGNTDVIIDVVGYLVSAGSAAPSITFTSLPSGTIGKAYTSTLEATGGVTPYTWSIVYGALPGGLSLSAATGTISGTPTTGGTSEFTVQIEDANGNTDAVAFSISIGNPCAAQPTFAAPSSNGPSITTTALVGGTVGLSYRASLAATGGTAPYTWSVVSGCLPQGLVLESSGSIIGTPTTPGLASFLVEATDSASPPATSTQALTIDVVQALAINTPSLLGGVVGVPYSMTLSAYGGVPAEYTWAVSSGSLPPGITLAPTSGLLSGTPTSAGTYNFTLEASENEPPDQSASQSYTITIEPASTPGVVLSPTYAAGANTTYSIYFTLTAALDGSNSSNQGTITLTAPTGTSWPTSACGECYQVNDNTNPNADFADTTSGCCGGGVTLTNNDTVAQIQVQNTLNAGDSLQIVISGVTNPPTANPAETIQVATSSDPSPVTSAPYPITYTSVSQPVVSLSPTSAAGATTTYTIDLTLSAYGTLDGGQQGTITLTAPTGTSWPTNNYSGCRISYQVNDNTNPGANFEAGCYNGENVTLTNNNTVVQIPVWSTLNAGDSLQIVISGVTNPPTANPAETIQVMTSSDPRPEGSLPYAIASS